MGLIAGDGSCWPNGRQWNVRLRTTNPELLEAFVATAERLGFHVTRYTWVDARFKWDKYYEQQVLDAYIRAKPFCEFCRRYKPEPYKWVYPGELDSPDFALGFLCGLFDADGDVSQMKVKGKIYPKISLTQKYTQNLDQARALLERFGIFPSPSYSVLKSGTYVLSIYSKASAAKFRTMVGSNLPSKRAKLASLEL